MAESDVLVYLLDKATAEDVTLQSAPHLPVVKAKVRPADPVELEAYYAARRTADPKGYGKLAAEFIAAHVVDWNVGDAKSKTKAKVSAESVETCVLPEVASDLMEVITDSGKRFAARVKN